MSCGGLDLFDMLKVCVFQEGNKLMNVGMLARSDCVLLFI